MPHPSRSSIHFRALCLGLFASSLTMPAGGASPLVDDRSAVELRRAGERGQLCSADNAVGSGLRAEYFARAGDRKATLVRIDKTVDFDRTFDWPSDSASLPPTAARWTGWVKPPYSGTYRFHVDRGAANVVVARRVVVDGGVSNREGIRLEAGRFYPIEIDAMNLIDLKGRFMLEWTAPHGARYVVPRALLFVPTVEPAS